MSQRNRVQVDYNPGQTSLEGAVGASAGNYQVSVAPTPKTNAALQFASVINQLPNVAGQAPNYMNKVAQEKLSMMTEDELLEELAGGDKDALNILQYNKSYNYGLVEKNFKRNLEGYQKRYDELAAQIESYPDPEAFETAIDNLELSIGQEVMKQTANDYQRKAGQALLFNAMPALKAKSLVKYQAYKQDATIQISETKWHDAVAGETTTMTPIERVRLGLDGFLGDLKQFSNITPTQRSRLAEQFVYNVVARYEANGMEGPAISFLDAASTYELYQGAKLGSIGDNAVQFSRLKERLMDVEEVKEETHPANRARVINSAKTAYRILHVGETDSEGISVDIDDLVNAVSTNESAEWKQAAMRAIIEQIDLTNPSVIERSSSLARALGTLKGQTNNARTRDFLNSAIGEVEDSQRLYLEKQNLDPEDTAELDEVVSDFVTLDSWAEIPEDWVIPATGKKVSSGSAVAIESLKKARAKLPWLVADKKTDPLLDYFGTLAKTINKNDFDDFSSVVTSRLINHLRNTETNKKAWDAANEDVVTYKDNLAASAKNFIAEQKREYDLDKEYENLTARQNRIDNGVWDVTGVEFKELEQEINNSAEKGGAFTTIGRLFGGGDAIEEIKSLKRNFEFNVDTVVADRETLLKAVEKTKGKDRTLVLNALAYSLQKFGFSSLGDINEKQLRTLRVAGGRGVIRPNVLISKVPIGDDFKAELLAALNFKQGTIKKPKSKKSYDLVVEKLKADEVDEIQFWKELLKNN